MPQTYQGRLEAAPLDRYAIVISRYNESVTSRLLSGAMETLASHGVADDAIDVAWVPGAFEIPLVATRLAETSGYDGVICLGAVIRGETAHFDYVAGECARGIQQVAVAEAMPIIFGVLTVNDEKQAHERIGGIHGHAGERAAEAAAEMIVLARKLGPGREGAVNS